jgi:hypothetical protein
VKFFTLHYCRAELKHDEKWKNPDVLDVPKKIYKNSMIDAKIVDDDEASSEDGKRSPHSKLCC